MSVKQVAVLASAALAASSVFLVVQPASGALVTRCTGVAGAVTVPNNLVVPRGQSCTLEGTTVTGDVRVQAGADLALEGATVTGNVVVVDDGFADVVGSSIGGSVTGRNHFGIFLEDSTVAGSISQRNPAGNELSPFVFTLGADVAGAIDSRAGQVLLESSTVGGDLFSQRGEYTDVVDSVVSGALTVRANSLGSLVCESELYGPALFEANGGTLQIGGGGAVAPCDGASFWGSDVSFVSNTATDTGLDVSNNIVAGSLSGEGNDPAPTGAGNRVRGEVSGQFTDLQPAGAPEAAQVAPEAQLRSLEVPTTRADDLVASMDQRRAVATVEAEETPSEEVLELGAE